MMDPALITAVAGATGQKADIINATAWERVSRFMVSNPPR